MRSIFHNVDNKKKLKNDIFSLYTRRMSEESDGSSVFKRLQCMLIISYFDHENCSSSNFHIILVAYYFLKKLFVLYYFYQLNSSIYSTTIIIFLKP